LLNAKYTTTYIDGDAGRDLEQTKNNSIEEAKPVNRVPFILFIFLHYIYG